MRYLSKRGSGGMGLSGRVMTRTPRLRGWEHGHTVKHGRALPYVPQPVATSVGACCLIGFWDVPNFGDEWLFRAGQSFLREAFPGCRLSALVGSSQVERRLGRHAEGLALLDGFFPDPAFFRKLPAIVQAIRSADLTLIGGGGLINDTYTLFSIPRYTVPALLATALGTPVVWWGLGVVPPKRRVLRSLAMWTLRHAAAVLIRDPGSRAYLLANGVAASPGEDLSVLGPAACSTAKPQRPTMARRSLVVNFRDDRQDLAAGRLAFLEAQLDRFDRVVMVAAEPCDEPVYANLLDELTRRRPLAAIEVLPATGLCANSRDLGGREPGRLRAPACQPVRTRVERPDHRAVATSARSTRWWGGSIRRCASRRRERFGPTRPHGRRSPPFRPSRISTSRPASRTSRRNCALRAGARPARPFGSRP